MPKAYLVLNTKEEFEKLWKDAYNCGYHNGIHDGQVDALARAMFVVNEEFDEKLISEAEGDQRSIGIRKWKQQVKRDESVKRLGVREYLESSEKSK